MHLPYVGDSSAHKTVAILLVIWGSFNFTFVLIRVLTIISLFRLKKVSKISANCNKKNSFYNNVWACTRKVVNPRDESEKVDCYILGPYWCNKKVNPETYFPCGSYKLLVSNIAQKIKEKLLIQNKFNKNVSKILLKF